MKNRHLAFAAILFVLELLPLAAAKADYYQIRLDGTFISTGTYGQNVTLQAEDQGSGTRLLWFPAKAAFRAGMVWGNSWDQANIGNNSVAFGYSTLASGSASTAMGYVTTATGSYSTALGIWTTATGYASTAVGLPHRRYGVLFHSFGGIH